MGHTPKRASGMIRSLRLFYVSHLSKTDNPATSRLLQVLNDQELTVMDALKFRYTILYVENVRDTLDFYKAAFGLEPAMLHESGEYGELDTGGTTLSFSSLNLMEELGKSPGKANANSPSFEIAFETNDVATALARALDAGAVLVQDTEDMPWGQTIAYVTDNNGFLVELCTPIEAQP